MGSTVKPGTRVGIDGRQAALRLQLMASEIAARFGRRLAHRRNELGLTQRETAALIKLELPEMATDKQRVSDWETGTNLPSDPYKTALVKVMQVPDISYFYEQPDLPAETPDLSSEAMNGEPAWVKRIDQKLNRVLAALGVTDEGQEPSAGGLPAEHGPVLPPTEPDESTGEAAPDEPQSDEEAGAQDGA